MTLIKSISGIRGTIGGKTKDNLTPIDTVIFASAYGQWLKNHSGKAKPKVVIGRDARISGEMISQLVIQSLVALGIDVIDLGLSTTPTVEIMVPECVADGGIILTASHNPIEWNALKLLNEKGEFLSAKDGETLLQIAADNQIEYAAVTELGNVSQVENAIDIHIQKVLTLPFVLQEKIAGKKFKVVVDAVHSTGGIAIPALLKELQCEVIEMYCEPNGHFPHNPEPLAENLTEICKKVQEEQADLGIVVDPDVDRLALIQENGEMFGEEYTLVAVADYLLSKSPSATVSNLSSSRALRDITQSYHQQYYPAAVGEVNVVEKMKEVHALIGGEGNGGIIYPELHYGRDALVGVVYILSLLTERNISLSKLKEGYPQYFMSKDKIQLSPQTDVDGILHQLEKKYAHLNPTTIDGVKIDFEDEWIHFRKSNTEPIIRIYTEAKTVEKAQQLGEKFKVEISQLM